MDVKCVVCGEPWDFYGVNHGDMEKWERELFKKGAGCPYCEGVVPESGHFNPETFEDIEYGDEDPVERIFAWEDSVAGVAPKWERPKPVVLWTCAGCGVQAVEDIALDNNDNYDNDNIDYHIPDGAKCRRWRNSHRFHVSVPERTPAHKFGDEAVCEFCLDECYGCERPVSSYLEYGDVYDDGWCAPLEGESRLWVFCISCHESSCSECHSLPENCYCSRDDDDEDDDDDDEYRHEYEYE